MALVRLLYNNLGLGAVWSASTDVATLPAAHLGVENRSRACRTTADAAQWFKADLGSPQGVGAVALVSLNVTQDAVIVVEGNATDAWGAPTFQQALTPWDYATTGVLVLWFGAVTLRWWRVTIDDPANPDGYLQIGLIAVGPAIDFAKGPHEVAVSRVDPSAIEYAPSGTPYALALDPYTVVEIAQRRVAGDLVFGDLHTALGVLRKSDGILSVLADAPSATAAGRALNLYGRLVETPRLRYALPPDRFDLESLVFRESR